MLRYRMPDSDSDSRTEITDSDSIESNSDSTLILIFLILVPIPIPAKKGIIPELIHHWLTLCIYFQIILAVEFYSQLHAFSTVISREVRQGSYCSFKVAPGILSTLWWRKLANS